MNAPGDSVPAAVRVRFVGWVGCEPLRGGRDWRLSGQVRAANGAEARQLLLSGVEPAEAAALPAQLQQLEVQVNAHERGGYRLQLLSADGRFSLRVRALQLHRDASAQFFRAVTPVPVPWHTRALWALLLTLLRVPVVSRRLIRSSQ
jgi:hypothetical protein